ncbi:MAG: glycosyltransferase [Pseudomonadota bacterium]
MAWVDGFEENRTSAQLDAVGSAETDLAANRLADRAPFLSSRRLNGRVSWLWRVIGGIALLGLLAPGVVISTLSNAFLALFFTMIVLRGALVAASATYRRKLTTNRTAFSPMRAWPDYTLLIPLYDEAESVPGLVEALKRLDYPAEKKEVIFLTEETDSETTQALRRSCLPTNWSILVLPDGFPRTKPRALNVGLQRACGKYLTIYDAEDRPHPSQLKAAVSEFEQSGSQECACVQAPLRAHNAACSWTAGQWGLEYDVHFGLVVPALADARLPIALGGTSNHFRVDVLKAVGGWDAWNVTEDADLGLRFARLGWKVSSISPPTLEEAPEKLSVWTAQRSRWIKGYIQTWAVLMTRPLDVAAEVGVRGYLCTHLLLAGAILSACLHGPLFIWCLASLAIPGMGVGGISLAVVSLGYLVSAVSAILAPGNRRHRWLLVMTLPIYWPLLSIAATRAIVELFRSPYSWAKTPHGLTAHAPSLDPAAFY